MRKGSMTVFATLSLMLVAGFLFALLEAARIVEIHKVARVNTSSVAESMFANYEIPLWERFHLLGVDVGGERETSRVAAWENYLQSLSASNLAGNYLMKAEISQVLISDLRRMTDENGRVFIAEVASYMKNNLGVEAAKALYDQYDTWQTMENDPSCDPNSVDTAEEALKEAKEKKKQQETDSEEAEQEVEEISEKERKRVEEKLETQPLEEVQKRKKGAILTMVLGKSKEVSENRLDLSTVVSHRKCCKGSSTEAVETDKTDVLYLQQYVNRYFSSYVAEQTADQGLRYEKEYILCGKASDRENLKAVAERLLALREVANMVYLLTDTQKMEEARLVALALAGGSLIPAVVEIVKIGILASWAYAESVLDVRALLQGKKIAFVKNREQWTTDIYSLASSLSGDLAAKPCSNGADYDAYLGIMLFAEKSEKIACRAMDLQEASIRKTEGYEDFRMDHLAVEAAFDFTYGYQSLFYGSEGEVFMQKGSYQYRKAGG